MACLLISGPNTMNCETTRFFKISGDIQVSDIRINISYTGSSLLNGEDFTGNSYVVIKANTSGIEFRITTISKKSGIIKITLDSEINQCEEFIVKVDCNYNITGNGNNPLSDIDSCEEIGFFWEHYQHRTRLPRYML